MTSLITGEGSLPAPGVSDDELDPTQQHITSTVTGWAEPMKQEEKSVKDSERCASLIKRGVG